MPFLPINAIAIGRRRAGVNWSAYWASHYISDLAVISTSDTTQTITATLVGSGFDGASFEYSTDLGVTWIVAGTATDGIYLATELTPGVLYHWRARLYKDVNFGGYSIEVNTDTSVWCNYLSTPDAEANDITGDIDIIVDFDIPSPITPGKTIRICGKGTHTGSSDSAWEIKFLSHPTDGRYYFACAFTTDGIPSAANAWQNMRSYPNTVTNYNIRLKRVAATGDISLWMNMSVLIGPVTKTSGNLYSSSQNLSIGYYSNDQSIKINYLKIYNGISDAGGTLAVNFDANDFNPVDLTHVTSSTTGELWTLNKGVTGYAANSITFNKLFFLSDPIFSDIYLSSEEESVFKKYHWTNPAAGKTLTLAAQIDGTFTDAGDDTTITPAVADIGDTDCSAVLTEGAVEISKTVKIKIANNSVIPAKKILCIGDSLTDMGKYQNSLLSLLPDTTFLGIRKTSGFDIQSEGRGGWKLNHYFTLITNTTNHHSPFLQPVDPYKYYGATGFWKKTWTDPTEYDVYGYETFRDVKGFTQATGYLSSPDVNDVIYDTDLTAYKVWDGDSWETITAEILGFAFNFPKYLSAWALQTPDFVSLMTLTNDTFDSSFSSVLSGNLALKRGYDIYKDQLKTFFNSVTSVGSKVLYLIPPACNDATIYGEGRDRRAECLFYFARNVVNDFSSYADVYIVDVGSELVLLTDYADSVHPDDSGMAKIAKKLASAIKMHS